jgi:hypothetical protein
MGCGLSLPDISDPHNNHDCERRGSCSTKAKPASRAQHSVLVLENNYTIAEAFYPDRVTKPRQLKVLQTSSTVSIADSVSDSPTIRPSHQLWHDDHGRGHDSDSDVVVFKMNESNKVEAHARKLRCEARREWRQRREDIRNRRASNACADEAAIRRLNKKNATGRQNTLHSQESLMEMTKIKTTAGHKLLVWPSPSQRSTEQQADSDSDSDSDSEAEAGAGAGAEKAAAAVVSASLSSSTSTTGPGPSPEASGSGGAIETTISHDARDAHQNHSSDSIPETEANLTSGDNDDVSSNENVTDMTHCQSVTQSPSSEHDPESECSTADIADSSSNEAQGISDRDDVCVVTIPGQIR